MKYSSIISDFTWSYSRITQFEMCPYAFFLRYVLHTPKKHLFFSSYGSFIHKLIEQCLNGELAEDELPSAYLTRFRQEVLGTAPNDNIFRSYFDQGYAYVSSFRFPYRPLFVEHRVSFQIGDKPFTGIIDCVSRTENGDIILTDNKSRALKPRSGKKKSTKSDEELDQYLRQLYLYSVPIYELFHVYPTKLEFNCFRTGQWISEPFQKEALEQAKEWALREIDTITENDTWSPKLEYWKCRHICDNSGSCEYCDLCFGR